MRVTHHAICGCIRQSNLTLRERVVYRTSVGEFKSGSGGPGLEVKRRRIILFYSYYVISFYGHGRLAKWHRV